MELIVRIGVWSWNFKRGVAGEIVGGKKWGTEDDSVGGGCRVEEPADGCTGLSVKEYECEGVCDLKTESARKNKEALCVCGSGCLCGDRTNSLI
jgi:hypothetical protein